VLWFVKSADMIKMLSYKNSIEKLIYGVSIPINMATIAIYLKDDLEDEVRHYAEKDSRSVSNLVSLALKEYFKWKD